MVTSDFSPEVEIRRFRACAIKNMQYSPYLWPNRGNFRVIQEIRVEEHDGDVNFSPEVEIRRFAHAQCIRPYLLENQFVHYGRCYGADTTFHRTHF